MKKGNAGLSLVELIVVIAIIAVMSGVGLYGIGQISGYRAKQCAKQIESSLTSTKVTTLGKAKSTGDIYWELYKDAANDGFYVKTVYNAGLANEYAETKKVGVGNLNVQYSGTSIAGVVNTSNSLKLCYNRASGEICDWSAAPPSTYSRTNVTEILVKNPSGTKSYKITLVPATGKVVRK